MIALTPVNYWLELGRAGKVLKRSFLQLLLTLKELFGDTLATYLAIARIHHNKLAVIVSKTRSSFDLEIRVDFRPVLALNQVRDAHFVTGDGCTIQLLALLDRYFLHDRLVKVDRRADPSCHLVVLAKGASLVCFDKGLLFQFGQ